MSELWFIRFWALECKPLGYFLFSISMLNSFGFPSPCSDWGWHTTCFLLDKYVIFFFCILKSPSLPSPLLERKKGIIFYIWFQYFLTVDSLALAVKLIKCENLAISSNNKNNWQHLLSTYLNVDKKNSKYFLNTNSFNPLNNPLRITTLHCRDEES